MNVGTASVTIKGKSNYRGSVTKNFKIYKDTFKAGAYMATTALKNNFVMDVADGSTGAGAGIQLYSSNGTDAQRFKIQKTNDGYYTIQNSKSDLYLTLYTTWADLKNGQQVTQCSYTRACRRSGAWSRTATAPIRLCLRWIQAWPSTW